MVDPFPFQLWEGTTYPAGWLSSLCLGQRWLIALMTLVVLTGPLWAGDKLGTAVF